MVYSEMMPSNGFGSPVSPPDVHFECREVPSPSQYSDPSYSPPSFHSPPHFSSGLDKQETTLKEEPASPYNGYGYTSLHASQNSLQTDLAETTIQSSESRQQIYNNYQSFSAYQQALFNNCPTSKLNSEVKAQLGMNVQKWDETKTSLDYELQQILGCTEEVNELETFAHQTYMNENSGKGGTVIHFQQQQQQPQSLLQQSVRMPPAYNQTMQQQKLSQECQQPTQNQQQQAQCQMPRQLLTFQQQQQLAFEQQPKAIVSDDAMKLLCSGEPQLNPETSTIISVPSVGSSSSQTPPPEPHQSVAVESYPNFESIIDDGDIQATMDPNSNSTTVVDFLKDMLKKTIYDAGVPQNPYEWTASHVRAWLRKAATAFELKLPENIGNLNIDGPTLLSLNPNQFNSMLASKGDSSLHAVTTLLVILHNDARMVSPPTDCKEPMQVKQESPCDDSHLPTESASAMIPTSVVNHNRTAHFHLQSQNTDQSVASGSPQSNHQVGGERKPSLDQFIQLPTFPQPSAPQQQLQQAQQQRQFQQQQQQVQQHLLQQQQQQQTKMEQVSSDSSSPPYSGLQVKQNIQQLNVAFAFSPQSPATSSATQLPDNSVSPHYVSTQPPAPKTTNIVPSKPTTMMPSPSNQPVSLQEGINSYINDSGADLSTLLQQQSPQHPATLDAEESMDTDEDVDDDVPASCTGGSGRSHIQLWQFLKELLNNNKKYGSCIRWLDRQEAIFKIEDSVKVASLWGERKNRPQMNYDKLSRSIRQYYNKNIMKKTERSQRLVYQFCSPYGQ